MTIEVTINDLPPAIAVDTAMQFETDIGGTVVNKLTVQQIADYIANYGATTPTNATTATSFASRFAQITNVKDFGALGDGVTDDAPAINAASLACFNSGGGILFFPPGQYIIQSERLIVYAKVLFNGGYVGAVELKQADNANIGVVGSVNFDTLTGTGHYYPSDPNVPYFFGLSNIRINGNKANNTLGRGVSFYGNAQFLTGTVDVYDCPEDNIYTEASPSGNLTLWQGQEEGFYETVISRTSSGKGWWYRGCHNGGIGTCIIILAPEGDFGFYSDNSATFNGLVDKIDLLHVYGASTNNTNRQGIYLGSGAGRIGALIADSVSVIIDTPNLASGHTNINTLSLTGVGRNPTNNKGLIVNDSQVFIDKIVGSTNASAVGCTFVEWNGSNGGCNTLSAFDNSSGAGNLGLNNTGSSNNFKGLSILGFKGTGSVGLTATNTYNNYEGFINNCKKGIQYTANTGNRMNIQIFTNSGQTAVGGDTPSSTSRIDIRSAGVVVGGTYVSVITSAGASNQVDLTSTAVQTITLAHTCLYTPAARNVQLSVSTTATDYTWDIFPQFVSATSTNLTIKCKVGVAGGAAEVADIVAAIRMGA